MAPQEISQFNPREFVTKLLGAVSYKEKDVLERRFGLDKRLLTKGSKYSRKMKETLEEIGKSHNITRERVRQIEASAIRKLKDVISSDMHQDDIKQAVSAINGLLDQYGQIMAEEHLIEAFFHNEGDLTDNEEDEILQKQSLLFLVSQLLTDYFAPIKTDKKIITSWKRAQADENFLRQTIAEFEHIIDAEGIPQNFDALISKFKQTPFYQTNQEQLHEQYLLASLRAAKNIKSNKFSEWGLTHWRTVIPKKTNDKIYLVLKKEGRPLHFTEIAQKINEIGFDHKSAYPATVHNELILDENYVLVGRGIYALKEWGYTPGVVSDVIANILKQVGHPMDKEEIVEKVMSQRMVKKSTIYLSLMNKKKFKKVEGNKYTLVS